MARPHKQTQKDSVRTDETEGPTLDSDDEQDEDPPNNSTATTPSATPHPPDTSLLMKNVLVSHSLVVFSL
ncbi:hypothetical protein MJO28_016998 [Puccinia striiformis f. sp. tritici]|nr:hypothetical protein MJO28_016998 [Puccinia striiformis f. sp. tritici]